MLNHNDEIANTMIIVPLDKSPGGVVFFSSSSSLFGGSARDRKNTMANTSVRPVTLLASIACILQAFEEWEENDTTQSFRQRMENRAHHPSAATPFCVCSEMFWRSRHFQSFRSNAGSPGHPANFTGRSKCRCWGKQGFFCCRLLSQLPTHLHTIQGL